MALEVSYPSLQNKLILVTGATSGIGEGVCKNVLSQGAKVIGIGRDGSKIKDTLFTQKKFFFKSFDLVKIDEIESLIKDCISEFGKLDGIVFCAGREETIPLSVYKNEKIKSLFDLNTFSAIEILRVFSKKKNSNNNSSVVFLSSVMGELAQPGILGYCATKSAILGVVKSSALELSNRGIRVNAVSPGVVRTPMSKDFFEKLTDDNIDRIKSMHPLGIGEIENISPIITFLLSIQSSWITGQNFKVDGGYSIQ